MAISRIQFKKSFSFSSLPTHETQVHVMTLTQAKNLEKVLPSALLKQYQTKKIELKDGQSTTFSLNFSEGGTWKAIAFDPKQSAFDLHTSCRKLLSGFFKANEQKVYVNLAGLNSSQAEFWIDAIVGVSICEKWTFPKVSKEKPKDLPKEYALSFVTLLTEKAFQQSVKKAEATATATNLVRTLALTPGNHLRPEHYRQELKKIADKNKFKYEFWDRKELLKKGAGAFLAVTQADPDDKGGIAKLVYKPKSAKNKNVLTLVGKGLCFDTGGYNIKTGSYMNGMHEDMTGSAIALASLIMLSEMNFPLEVHAYLALAENHVSPTGFKPNDVVTASNGKTIEVENTDAEGRMVLSDTLALASKEKPGLIIDYATLTGACFRALSTFRSGVFSNRPAMLNQLQKIGDESGERLWGFPISQDYEEGLKSDIADILQCAHELNADHIYAATFLNHFVEKDVPWIHIDLSAHSHKGGLGIVSGETNGFGCRLTRHIAEAFLNKKLTSK